RSGITGTWQWFSWWETAISARVAEPQGVLLAGEFVGQGALAGLSIKSLPRQEVAENHGGGHDNDNGNDGRDDNNHRRCHPSADRLQRGRRLAQDFLRSRRDHGRPVLGDGKAQDHGRCRRRSGRLPDSQEHAARLRHGRAGAALPPTRHEGRAAGH
ncbi:unnamed protein product, partial [Ectocarpus sp. 6 AP-2014]